MIVFGLLFTLTTSLSFADGFVSGTFFMGYYSAEDAYWSDGTSVNLGTAGLCMNFLSTSGFFVTVEVFDAFKSGYGSRTIAGAGLGWSFTPIKMLSMDAALMVSADPIIYGTDTCIGPRAGLTYWFGDIGVTGQLAYYFQFANDFGNWFSARAGVSVKR